MAKEKDPSVKLDIPMNIVRWLIYSLCFFILLTPFVLTVWQWICMALIIGWFASLLNAVRETGKELTEAINKRKTPIVIEQ